MAFIDIDSEDPVKYSSFYNLTDAVGYGCKNLEEDVKVVQFFLKRAYMIPGIGTKPFGEMVIDGKCGPTTRRWITKFQMDGRLHKKNLLADGIINKAGNESNYCNWKASISKTEYTIRLLNDMIRNNDSAVYKTLTTNPEVPQDVRLIFQQIHAQGPPMYYAAD